MSLTLHEFNRFVADLERIRWSNNNDRQVMNMLAQRHPLLRLAFHGYAKLNEGTADREELDLVLNNIRTELLITA